MLDATKQGLLRELGSLELTGSALICPEEAMDTDYIWGPENHTTARLLLTGLGFYRVSDEHYPGGDAREVYRHDASVTDVILMLTPEAYKKWRLAGAVAKYLSLCNKDSRIAIFEAIVDGNFPPEEVEILTIPRATEEELFY